jgi:Sap, sulfolipid-1-addressing protein
MLPQLITAAVVGALSPAAVLSAIMLLASRRPVANTVACLVGWTVVLVALGALLEAVFGDDVGASDSSAKAIVGVLVGLLLLAASLRTLLGGKHPLQDAAVGETPPAPEIPGWMQKLEHLKTWQALAFGMLLICVSPADLAAYFAGVQALLGSDLSDGGKTIALVLLILGIDLCILVPLLIYILLPRRASRILDGAKLWTVAHQRAVTGWSAAVFGVVLIVNGILSVP